ncbi:MAG: CehA/McbA family metallohydrolase [Armatimonadota bacterium]
MPEYIDGPASSLFTPLPLRGNAEISTLEDCRVSEKMIAALAFAPVGNCVCWGIPFNIEQVVVLRDEPVSVPLDDVKTRWLVFQHTADVRLLEYDAHGFPTTRDGAGRLGEHAADYVIVYADGSEERHAINQRFQIGYSQRGWGENCFETVGHIKPHPVRAHHEQTTQLWGGSQTRVSSGDSYRWANWLWAWENPYPEKAIAGIRFEPVEGTLIISGISCGSASSLPLRWGTRRKAVLRLPEGETFDPSLDENGLLQQIRLDLGQVISATPRLLYPDDTWGDTYNNRLPEPSTNEIIIEYTAHDDACFHLAGGVKVPVRDLVEKSAAGPLSVTPPATRRVRLRVVDKTNGKPVAVKLHVHGESGEYLSPVDRHRIPNAAWYEDYSVDFTNRGLHHCTYIPGETTLDLPLGRVYIEVSKGFEIRPIRLIRPIGKDTEEITIALEKILPWREKSWVTADTHVHFLSPPSALLEGAGEGVNIVNLLASQWGELMTNVGDFDGKTTFGSREAGGDGEFMVRVGTENRQHIMGHISLLGYRGNIIAPMTTGGPDESALGDPIEILLTEWAKQCKAQGGTVVLPHFPNPRAEHAAAVVSGNVDAVEMTSWGNLYGGIDPYSLVDWYRYLNCGYLVAAVGGTDKMSAGTAVGTVRTYAHLKSDEEFTYEAWQRAVGRAETFVTYGPLVEFSVEGKVPGSRIEMPAGGGTVDVAWKVASVTVPMSRVELVVNGEIRESLAIDPQSAEGSWSVKVDGSCWLALLVRGHYDDKPEIVAAHTSPVMVQVEDSPLLAAADAVTILRQIEGALAYLDTVGTRAETAAYQRMRLELTSAHRSLHNRLHDQGCYHPHSPVDDHAAHHE